QAVKSVKFTIKKTGKPNIDPELFAWRNTPRADGYSPAQMMFNIRQRGYLPMLPNAYKEIDSTAAYNRRKEESVPASDRPVQGFSVGDEVIVQDPITKKCTTEAIVKKIRDNERSYILVNNGRKFIRNKDL
ncbi:Putative LOC100905314, partial [Caligus rogercresseyi]